MLSFTDLGLPEPITRAIKELGFQKPTEIQEKALISLLDKDIDLIGLAQTGTGKTAAFGLPLLSKIDPQKRHVQALILSPTRELGQQIAEQMQLFGKYISNMGIMAVYGGASITNQIKDLKKAKQIVIATPGRLNDLIRRKAIQLENVGLNELLKVFPAHLQLILIPYLNGIHQVLGKRNLECHIVL